VTTLQNERLAFPTCKRFAGAASLRIGKVCSLDCHALQELGEVTSLRSLHIEFVQRF